MHGAIVPHGRGGPPPHSRPNSFFRGTFYIPARRRDRHTRWRGRCRRRRRRRGRRRGACGGEIMRPAPRRGEETGWPSYARVVCAAAAAPPSAVFNGCPRPCLTCYVILLYYIIIMLYDIMVTYTTRTGNGADCSFTQ
ncbi:unnamed protein product [Aphis gossypii]|uniref:Uncharacterized protein n=1 Tax=Aphis gossypii TaxID=80765 RepID=A0A9P0NKV2_APHGO|nr:unnamed protein product [Aphis gossypii]